MTQKLVTFSDSVLHVDSATIYECWKSGDIVGVRLDGQTHFVSSDLLHSLASEGLVHQDGICGKGWGGTTGFCKRLKRMKYMQSDRYSSRMKKKALEMQRSMDSIDEDHQDGICGKGWVGSTKGFCKRVKKVQAWDKKRTEDYQKMSPEDKAKRLATAAVIGGTIGFLAEKGNRQVIARSMNNFARKAGESAGRAASKYKGRGVKVIPNLSALPPGFRKITETF